MGEVTLSELEKMVRAQHRHQSRILDAYRRWTETQSDLPKTVEGMEQLYTAFKQGWMEEKQRDEIRRLNHEFFGSLPVMTTPPDVWLTRALEFDRAFRETDQDGDS